MVWWFGGQTVVLPTPAEQAESQRLFDKKLAGGPGTAAVKGWTFQVLIFTPGLHAFIFGSSYDFSNLSFYRHLRKQEQTVLTLKLPVFKMSSGFADI